MDIKQYIGFNQTHGDKQGWKVYKLDKKKGWYLLPDNNTGHHIDDVQKYPHAFLFGDTEEEVLQQIKEKQHQAKYGIGKEGDVACPKCGFMYSFDYMDNNDGYYTPAIKEDFQETVNCICGHRFTAKIKCVKIEWETK